MLLLYAAIIAATQFLPYLDSVAARTIDCIYVRRLTSASRVSDELSHGGHRARHREPRRPHLLRAHRQAPGGLVHARPGPVRRGLHSLRGPCSRSPARGSSTRAPPARWPSPWRAPAGPRRRSAPAPAGPSTSWAWSPWRDAASSVSPGGQRQKIAHASIWALRPPNLPLDEPTSNLDMPSIADIAVFVASAKASGRSILVAEHRMARLSGIADTYVRLDGGRMARARPRCAAPCAASSARRGGRFSWTGDAPRAGIGYAPPPRCFKMSVTSSSPRARRPR